MKYVKLSSRTIINNTGLYIELPVLLIEQDSKVSILWPLHQFLIKYSSRSPSWRNKLIQAVSLLLDYMDANQNSYKNAKSFFEAFANAVYDGTINENGSDPSGLYWLPKSAKTARILLTQLSDFSDWMFIEYGTNQLNPWREATKYEEKLKWMALVNKSQHSFLGHLDSYKKISEAARNARNIVQRRIPSGDKGSVKAFPEDRIHELLWKGFKKPDKNNKLDFLYQYNWRDIAITILLHGGGLRVSEPFHIWIQDVMPDPFDPQYALVRVYDPINGIAPKDLRMPTNGKTLPNREAYLHMKYGLKPRNKISGLRHAGWKNPKMSDTNQNYIQVHWFPRQWGYLFMQVWKMYMAQRIHEKISDLHPFLFVSFKRDKKGDMYTIKSYREAHKTAVAKIGLTSAKMLGTTEHGHRHAYGQRETISKLDRSVIQAGLHHKSDESQDVYTEPTIDQVTETLRKASEALENGQQLSMNVDLDVWYKQEKKIQQYWLGRKRD